MEEFDLNNSPDLEPESVKQRLGHLLEEAAQTLLSDNKNGSSATLLYPGRE